MNGEISFEINGVLKNLFFGTLAVKIYTIKSAEEFVKISENYIKENGEDAKELSNDEIMALLDQDLSFSYMIYAGLCNYNKVEGLPEPSYKEAYQLTEDIFYHKDKKLQSQIMDCYLESRATKAQIEKLPISTEEKKKKQTGMKSKAMPIQS